MPDVTTRAELDVTVSVDPNTYQDAAGNWSWPVSAVTTFITPEPDAGVDGGSDADADTDTDSDTEFPDDASSCDCSTVGASARASGLTRIFR